LQFGAEAAGDSPYRKKLFNAGIVRMRFSKDALLNRIHYSTGWQGIPFSFAKTSGIEPAGA
jgi:hypothetical protein